MGAGAREAVPRVRHGSKIQKRAREGGSRLARRVIVRVLNLKGEAKFEASDVVRIGEHFYSICDSSWAVLRVHESLPMRSKLNAHMGDPQHGFAEGGIGLRGHLPRQDPGRHVRRPRGGRHLRREAAR